MVLLKSQGKERQWQFSGITMCPGRVWGTDVCILVLHSNCPIAALLWRWSSYFPKSKEVAWKQKRRLIIHCQKPLFIQQGLEKRESGLQWGVCWRRQEGEAWQLPLTGSLGLRLCVSIQPTSHPRPFLQPLPPSSATKFLLDHCLQCPRSSSQLSYLHLSFTFQESQLAWGWKACTKNVYLIK